MELSDSMVGSYISKFNTWGAQTDDCKLESNIKLDTEDTDTQYLEQYGDFI